MNIFKKIFISLILFSTLNLNAQEISFGVKGGINYSTLSGNHDANGIGFHFGGLMNIGLSDKHNIKVGLLASQRKLSYTKEGESFGLKFKTTGATKPLYIAIPIMYKFDLNDKIAIMAGPQISFLVFSSHYEKIILNGDLFSELKLNGTDGSRLIEFAMTLGGEYSLTDNIGIGIKYLRGLQSYTNFKNSDDYFNVFQASFIYNF